MTSGVSTSWKGNIEHAHKLPKSQVSDSVNFHSEHTYVLVHRSKNRALAVPQDLRPPPLQIISLIYF